MTDLTKGIIEINGFTFRPETTLEEVKAYYGDNARLLQSYNLAKIKLVKPYYITKDIYSCAFTFNESGKISRLSLIPTPPESIVDHGYGERTKFSFKMAEEWLGKMIAQPATNHTDMVVSYSFDWGYIGARCSEDRDYGLVGGDIDIIYRW